MVCEIKNNLNGKVAVVTGGGSGVGFEAAENLARHGAKVIIASRNETKLKEATNRIKERTGNQYVAYKTVDLASLSSVREFASAIYFEDRLDILINNAGAVGLPDRLTEDGLNLSMQVNYFGVFLLTYLLVPMLKRSSPSRIVFSTALSMYIGNVDFEHWNDTGRYNFLTSLGNSKLAENLLMVEMNDRLKGTEVTVIGFDPFVVRDTDILVNLDAFISGLSKILINLIGRDKKQVGAEMAFLSSESNLKEISGKNFKFCHESFNHWLANDKELRRRLWDISKEAVKVTEAEDWDSTRIKY